MTRRDAFSLVYTTLLVALLLYSIHQDREAERAYARFATAVDSLHATVKARD